MSKNKRDYRAENLRNRYRMTLTQYDEMLSKQAGVCAICGGVDPRRLVVDHYVEEGQIIVRGLLCGACNIALGQFDHDVNRILAAVSYLHQHKP